MMQQGIMSKLDALRQNMGQGQGQPAPAAPTPMTPPIQNEPQPEPMLMQDQAPEMVAEAEQPAPVDAGEDAQKLASAVLQRSQGNPQLALDIIEEARGVVIQTIQGSERPRMMSMGGATGGDSSAPQTQAGRRVAEARTFSDRDLQIARMLAEANAQSGRSISDKDIEFYLQMLPQMKNGGATDNLPNEGLKALAKSGEKGKKAVEAMGFMAEGGGVSEALERLNYLRGLS